MILLNTDKYQQRYGFDDHEGREKGMIIKKKEKMWKNKKMDKKSLYGICLSCTDRFLVIIEMIET